MHRLRLQRDEVPERIVGRRRLRDLVVRLRLHRVYEVGKLDGVLDKEHRHIVADQVVVALARIELDGKAAHVARQVRGAARARHGGKAYEHRRLRPHTLEEIGRGEIRQRFMQLKVAMRGGAARVHHPLRNALVVKVGDLLAQQEVFQQRGAACAQAQRVVVLADRHALVGGQHAILVGDHVADRVRAQGLGLGSKPLFHGAVVRGIGPGGCASGSLRDIARASARERLRRVSTTGRRGLFDGGGGGLFGRGRFWHGESPGQVSAGESSKD